MTPENISRGSANGLPQALITAQQAIHLPEVQEMLRKLSEFKLGIFMPHRHDEQTGKFQELPDEVVQVESGLEVSFQPKEKIVNQIDQFLAVAWIWGADAPTPSAVCEMVWDDKLGDTQRFGKHKMLKVN